VVDKINRGVTAYSYRLVITSFSGNQRLDRLFQFLFIALDQTKSVLITCFLLYLSCMRIRNDAYMINDTGFKTLDSVSSVAADKSKFS